MYKISCWLELSAQEVCIVWSNEVQNRVQIKTLMPLSRYVNKRYFLTLSWYFDNLWSTMRMDWFYNEHDNDGIMMMIIVKINMYIRNTVWSDKQWSVER